MANRNVVNEAEWRAARQALLVREKELTHAMEKLHAERRELPWVRVDKDYTLEGPAGAASLADMFEGRRQLVVYHFMFAPAWKAGCDGCSFLVDSIGHLAHLHAGDTTIALVSHAELPKLQAYQRRMGWQHVPWYSSFDSDFNRDFGGTTDRGEEHGISVFIREGDDIYFTYSTWNRGPESLLTTFNWLDFTHLGRQEDEGTMHWIRRHDEYGD